MEICIFRGNLTDILARKEALLEMYTFPQAVPRASWSIQADSDFVQANMSVRSPRKKLIFIFKKFIHRIEVSQKYLFLILQKKSLLTDFVVCSIAQ